jgi:hypothetical protein
VSLYEGKIWSLTLSEEHRLRIFKNRVLRIFGPKRDEVTRQCDSSRLGCETAVIFFIPLIIWEYMLLKRRKDNNRGRGNVIALGKGFLIF